MSKYEVDAVYVDGANPSFIRSLKLQIGEDPEYDKQLARLKSQGFDISNPLKFMKIVPVNFNKEAKAMLGHCKMILETDGGRISINQRFDKLIVALRTAVEEDGTLDKESTSFDDVFDAFRLALKYYAFSEH